MKTISQHLTVGALAMAGTVATFGLGSVAQAVSINGSFDASGVGSTFTFAPTGNLGAATSYTTTAGSFIVTGAPTPFLGNPNDFRDPGGLFPLPLTTGNWAYAGDILAAIPANTTLFTFGPSGRFSFVVSGPATKVSGSPTTVGFTKLGQFVDSLAVYDTAAASISWTGQTADANSGVGSYSFSFGTPPLPGTVTDVPEPGTVLGILAVAGAGAFARRKR